MSLLEVRGSRLGAGHADGAAEHDRDDRQHIDPEQDKQGKTS